MKRSTLALFVVLFAGVVRAQESDDPSAKFKAAIAKLDTAIAESPDSADLRYRRGRLRFQAGDVKGSVEDFDRLVELAPRVAPQQWERGIALYYAGRYADGAKQFVRYQTFHDQDVENSVWRWLCQARDEGRDKATAAMLPIERDTRVPMMTIFEMFQGKATPEKVLNEAESPAATEREATWQRFYAHLYVGLYYEATGDEAAAKPHILAAADDHKVDHYMWDVARIHALRFRDPKPGEKP